MQYAMHHILSISFNNSQGCESKTSLNHSSLIAEIYILCFIRLLLNKDSDLQWITAALFFTVTYIYFCLQIR